MDTLLANRTAALSALSDPVRRALYRLAVDRAVTRDEASDALGIPRSTAAFHLERMAEAGLLMVEHRRLSGRSGPGAGRPSKLYRAESADLIGSIPERHYELSADLLASAVERAERDGIPVRDALAEESFAAGRVIGEGSASAEEALERCGYQPVTAETGDIVLENCPFHVLARRHTSLVCDANLHLVRGLCAATGDEYTASLEPQEGRCCVALHDRATA